MGGRLLTLTSTALRTTKQRTVSAFPAASSSPRLYGFRSGLFRGHAIKGGMTVGLDHDLDRILDALAGIFQRGRQILEREGVGMHLGRVKTLLRHERLGAVRRALAFAADAVDVDVVTHDIGDIDLGGFARKCSQTDTAAAIDHARGFVD